MDPSTSTSVSEGTGPASAGSPPPPAPAAVIDIEDQLEAIKRRLTTAFTTPQPPPASSPTPRPQAGPATGAAQKLGKYDYLVAQRLISRDDLRAAIADAKRQELSVESVLLGAYKVQRADIGAALSFYYRCPFVPIDERFTVAPELLFDLNIERLKAGVWVPYKREGDTLTVLLEDPYDLPTIDSIERLFPGQRVKAAVALRDEILRYLNGGGSGDPRKDPVSSLLDDLKDEKPSEEEADDGVSSVVSETDSVVVRLANQVIMDARRERASDIHIEPSGPRQETVIRFRVDGSCFEYMRVPGSLRHAVVARMKIMANLDIAERRKPQDGKIKIRLPDEEMELRVATIPTVGGNEDVVLRILTSRGGSTLPLDKVGLTDRNLSELQQLAEKPHGLILCVGPTGSGKTTTLHALLGHINKPDRKIWTAEDPVEITQPGLRQVQVQPKIGFTFAQAMRAFLRADPDVIMVGEMRDAETAAIGVEASLTGHLVLSTLHTNSAVETIVRLLDLGLDPYNFADALLGVLAQRLVKVICPDCKEAYNPTREEFYAMARAYGDDFEGLNCHWNESFELHRGRGCAACNQTGYRGRLAIHEMLVATEAIKRMTQTKSRVSEMLNQARRDGMTTLIQDGVLKVLKGVTDLKQVKAATVR